MSSRSRSPDMRETLEGGTPSLLHVWAPVSPLCVHPPSGALTLTSPLLNVNGHHRLETSLQTTE